MDIITKLNIILAVIIFVIFILGLIALLIILKSRAPKEKAGEIKVKDNSGPKRNELAFLTRDGKTINSIYKFMEFDDIVDNMIVRKNKRQYIMVIQCKGINYDLLSEEEKEAVEAGFVEMLNVLRYPIQLYVQTRSFNIRDLIELYRKKIDVINNQINKIDTNIQLAKSRGNIELVKELREEKNKKQNMYEYALSVEEYTSRMGEMQNILQQKTYIVVSYNVSEYGDVSNFSKEELNDIAFSELYTRCQTLIRALTSSEIVGNVLNSEELAELLYIAYNRDESEVYRLRDALDGAYNRLYSTAKDVMEERKQRINEQIEAEASQLAANSMIKADTLNREERKKKVKERAKEMIEEYKNDISNELYQETKKQIDLAQIDK